MRTHNLSYVRFEVFKALTTKIVVFRDVLLCGSCKNRRFGGNYRLHHQDDKNRRVTTLLLSRRCWRYVLLWVLK
jgi:hypothetical protein